MQIVIDIPEKDYDDILNGETKASALNWSTLNAIRNGTPLPENHGDLIDVNELNEFALNHNISGSAFDGELIYDAGETTRGDTIYETVIDKLTVVVKADNEE